MSLKVVRRKDTGTYQIAGTIFGRRIRKRAQSNNKRIAQEEAAALETRLLRDAWHGPQPGGRSFAEGVASYLKEEPRSSGSCRRLERIVSVVGNVPLKEMGNQIAIDRVRDLLYPEGTSPANVRRGIITPIRAVLRHCWFREWCDLPRFRIPRQPKGRTLYLLPGEAERLLDAAAPHLKPLIVFFLATGARVSEALELDWHEVDLVGSRVIFLKVKGRDEPRIAPIPPRVVRLLAAMPHREGQVFRWQTRAGSGPYATNGREFGGQIKKGFEKAVMRAGLNSAFTPHTLRHTWASWHYAIHKDPMKLLVDGGWSSLELVKRYAHLMPAGHENEIRAFWCRVNDAVRQTALTTVDRDL